MSHTQIIDVEHCLLEGDCTFCKRLLKKLALFRIRKQVPVNMFREPCLTIYTEWLASLMTTQNASIEQDKKIMQKAISKTHSSFQSECIKNKTSFRKSQDLSGKVCNKIYEPTVLAEIVEQITHPCYYVKPLCSDDEPALNVRHQTSNF